MPFDRDSLPTLIARSANEAESRLPGVLARVKGSAIGVIVRVLAGGLSTLQKYMEYLAEQWWVDRADEANLIDHGARWGKPRLPAAAATGSIAFAGVNGAAVPLGTVAQRSDGVQFATTAAGVIALEWRDVAGPSLFYANYQPVKSW